MHGKILKILAGAALLLPVPVSGQIVINEIMQSNIDCIMDDLNEFPDSWVELYNAGTTSQNLSFYKIGTKDKVSKAYKLPSKVLNPGEYVIVYCDKESTGYHTDFRLESGKDGAVYLFNNDKVIDKLEGLKKQPAPNIAYGRVTDGADKWGYQAVPTPGKTNCGKVCKDILPEPIFSKEGRVLTDGFALEIDKPADAPEAAVIRYTLNGLEPTEKSPAYEGPINISKTTTVRAKLMCEGYLSPRSTTHSYIMHPREMTMPIVSIVTDNDYFYGNKLGIYVEGSKSFGKPNYEFDWRRPINFEYFDAPDSESVINQLCETRVKGGATRKDNQLRSLAVYANKRFGEKRFNYEFFPEQTPGYDEFKSFELRNSGNDFAYLYMRDAIIQQSMGLHTDIDWQPSQPVVLYINGVFKGMLNVRPRSNEDNIYTYYDGEEDIDMFENWWELKEGTWDNYNAFKAFYEQTGHTYAEFQEWMDTEEFCNIMIMNLFYDNKDFPGNNIVMWRPRAEGGKWRWIAKDTDFGMGLYETRSDYPTITWVRNYGYDNYNCEWANRREHTRLFRRLLDTPEFKRMFIMRAAIYMGDFLNERGIYELLDKRRQEISEELPHHRSLINSWCQDFNHEFSWVKRWTRERVPFFYKHLASSFLLPTPPALTIDKDAANGRTLMFNDIKINYPDFDGHYFAGFPLKIESVSDTDGYEVTGWSVKVYKGSGASVTEYKGPVLDIVMPEGTKVEIKSILAPAESSIDAVEADVDMNQPYEVYDISGRYAGDSLDNLSRGVYIIRQGSRSVKRMVK